LQVPFHGARLIWKTYGFDPQVCEKCTIANQVPHSTISTKKLDLYVEIGPM
jgi:hypothetical protein